MRLKSKSDVQVIVTVNVTEFKADEYDLEFSTRGETSELLPLFSGPIWTAMIWEDSVQVICDFMTKTAESMLAFQGKRVVELGCGLGVPGLVAALTCQAEHVYLTDREEDLQVLRRSMSKQNTDLLPILGKRVTLIDYDWAEQPDDLKNQADVILAVECISQDGYGVESLDLLRTAINHVAARCVVSLYICSARRRDDGLDYVLEKLSQELNLVRPIELARHTGNIELYRVEFDHT